MSKTADGWDWNFEFLFCCFFLFLFLINTERMNRSITFNVVNCVMISFAIFTLFILIIFSTNKILSSCWRHYSQFGWEIFYKLIFLFLHASSSSTTMMKYNLLTSFIYNQQSTKLLIKLVIIDSWCLDVVS